MTFDCGFLPNRSLNSLTKTIASTMEPAFSQPFSIKVLERTIAILAMLRTCSDIFSKAGHADISKTKSPAWMLVTSGSAIIGVYLNEWTI